jgi:hypothetical protein
MIFKSRTGTVNKNKSSSQMKLCSFQSVFVSFLMVAQGFYCAEKSNTVFAPVHILVLNTPTNGKKCVPVYRYGFAYTPLQIPAAYFTRSSLLG